MTRMLAFWLLLIMPKVKYSKATRTFQYVLVIITLDTYQPEGLEPVGEKDIMINFSEWVTVRVKQYT